jgi:adhesin transport system outer membrane protein
MQKLDALIAQIKATERVVQIKIGGHTDNTGSDMINIPLSKARAEHVRDYLILNGLENINFQADGYGATRPIADNSDETGRLANRRVEVTVTRQL